MISPEENFGLKNLNLKIIIGGTIIVSLIVSGAIFVVIVTNNNDKSMSHRVGGYVRLGWICWAKLSDFTNK